jgi:hypothetical protein
VTRPEELDACGRRPEELGARGRRLRAALAAVLVGDHAPELRLVREWLDNWSGIGLIIAGRSRSWQHERCLC